VIGCSHCRHQDKVLESEQLCWLLRKLGLRTVEAANVDWDGRGHWHCIRQLLVRGISWLSACKDILYVKVRKTNYFQNLQKWWIDGFVTLLV